MIRIFLLRRRERERDTLLPEMIGATTRTFLLSSEEERAGEGNGAWPISIKSYARWKILVLFNPRVFSPGFPHLQLSASN